MSPAAAERTPQERETLIFPTAEQARGFEQGVRERLRQEQTPGVLSPREAVGQAVAAEFEQQGHPVTLVREPWLHTGDEHEEVQRLVDVAFAKDLGAALEQAERSQHFPRNIDLLHDVLTGQLYDVLRQSGLNRQPLVGAVTLAAIIVLCVVVVIFVILALSYAQ